MSETPSQLDAFLSSGAQPEVTETPAPQESKAAPEAAPTKAASTTKESSPKAAPELDDDAEPGEPAPHEAIVPRSAYQKERERRQNWVERAGRAEAERDALAKQLEDAAKAATTVRTAAAAT